MFTDADIRIQKTIQYNLKELFPKARIICEEEEKDLPSYIMPCIMPDEVKRQTERKKIFNDYMLREAIHGRKHSVLKYNHDLNRINRKFGITQRAKDTSTLRDIINLNEEDLTIWVDPLDGSKGFTEGHVHHLTCIIGVSVRNRPLLGVIHKPFSNYPFPGCGRTYIGTPEAGLFTVDNFVDEEGNFTPSQARYVPPFEVPRAICKKTFKPKICGSHNKNQLGMFKMLEAVRP